MAQQRPTHLAVEQRGRPVVHTPPWAAITVVMLERHVGYLDVMSVFIRLRHHKVVSRAEIIRGLVEFMIRSKIDFKRFATTEQMVAYLTGYFGRIPNRGRWPLLLESSVFQPERDRTEARTEQPPEEAPRIEVAVRT